MKTRILVGEYTPLMLAASQRLDAQIALGLPTHTSLEREAWVVFLVRLYQDNPQSSRDALAAFNERDRVTKFYPDMGKSVRERMEQLGIMEKRQ